MEKKIEEINPISHLVQLDNSLEGLNQITFWVIGFPFVLNSKYLHEIFPFNNN